MYKGFHVLILNEQGQQLARYSTTNPRLLGEWWQAQLATLPRNWTRVTMLYEQLPMRGAQMSSGA